MVPLYHIINGIIRSNVILIPVIPNTSLELHCIHFEPNENEIKWLYRVATGIDTNPTVNFTVEYLRWQGIFRSVFGLAVGLHVYFFVLFARFGDVHQIVSYVLAVQYHGDPLLTFLHLNNNKCNEQIHDRVTNSGLGNIVIIKGAIELTSLLPDMPETYTFTTIFRGLIVKCK